MLITPANLNIFFTGLETRFSQAYGATPVVYNRFATVYPVTTEVWLSGWLDMVDKYREWIGGRITKQPAPQTYQVPMQLFELTQGVDQFKLMDDSYGIYNPIVQYMGIQAAKLPDYQLRDLLQNQGSQTGTRQLSVDNLSHFNVGHPISFFDQSRGSYCNDFTGGGQVVNGVNVGGSLTPNSFATVWQDLARRKTESAEAWGLQADLTVAPAQLKFALDSILQSQFLGMPVIGTIGATSQNLSGATLPANPALVGASENQLKSWTDRLVWFDLGGPGTVGGGTYDQVWYMMDTSKVAKPLSWLQRQAPDFTYRNQPADPMVFDTHTFGFGSVARGAPAWSFPQFISRSGA